MQTCVNRLVLIGSFLLIIQLASSSHATIINVPSDHSSIQGAIDASSVGDTVLVSPGRYYVNLNFRSKQLVLASNYLLSGDPQDIWETILDGSQPVYPDTASVIIIAGYQDTNTAVIGFTITGGAGTRWRDVSDNLIYREGGGILTERSYPKIMCNLIVANKATETAGVQSAGGGGIRCGFGLAGESPVIMGNVFAFNQARYGGAVVSFHCPVIIKNNVFWGNSGGQHFGGAGIWMWLNSSVSVVENNTIIGNTTTNSGGGININSAPVTVINNIIRDNIGGQIAASGSGVVVEHNNIQGGYTGTGNVDQPPQFDATNFFLMPGSPCVDSGSADTIYYDREDTGNPGFALFPALGTLRNDKGAYGGQGSCIFPTFTSREFSLLTDSVDFGQVSQESNTNRTVQFGKNGYGPVNIDSVRFGHTADVNLFSPTTLPKTIPAAPASDSIVLTWHPTSADVLLDTARIYHSDTAVANPLLVIVTGDAQCCSGTTGNVDMTGIVNLADLSVLVAYLTVTPRPVLACFEEANVNGLGIIDLGDLSKLIGYLTSPSGTVVLPSCP